MKHPSFKILQDYFENETNSDKLRIHLHNCQKCSVVLSEMAKVDVLFSKANEIKVRGEVKKATFSAASVLLKELRDKKEIKSAKQENRKDKIENLVRFVRDWKEDALGELKLPALQVGSMAIMLFVITKVATTSVEVEHYQIINNDIEVTYSELQGLDTNEDYHEDN